MPKSNVPVTMMASTKIAGRPIAITSFKVSLKPYKTIPVLKTCFVQNLIPGTHVSGSLLRKELA